MRGVAVMNKRFFVGNFSSVNTLELVLSKLPERW